MTKLRGNPWAILVVVSLGFFMTLLEKVLPDAKTFDQRLPQLITCESLKEKL